MYSKGDSKNFGKVGVSKITDDMDPSELLKGQYMLYPRGFECEFF